MAIENIRLSQQAKDQLSKLKRYTGIKNWNTLCRWAFCISLNENTIPPDAQIPSDSNVEMAWKTFGGVYEEIYWALLKERCQKDKLGTNEAVLAKQFKLHLHRGIGYLAANKSIKNVSDLVVKAL